MIREHATRLGRRQRRRVVPYSRRDRLGALASIVIASFAVRSALNRDGWGALYYAGLFAAQLWLAYGIQDRPNVAPEGEEYSAVIERIGAMGSQLSDLSRFLERERAKIASTEAIVRKLRDERLQLEPVLATQRETVEAILAAHASRLSRTAWKERVYGFVIGASASLIASAVYDYIKR